MEHEKNTNLGAAFQKIISISAYLRLFFVLYISNGLKFTGFLLLSLDESVGNYGFFFEFLPFLVS